MILKTSILVHETNVVAAFLSCLFVATSVAQEQASGVEVLTDSISMMLTAAGAIVGGFIAMAILPEKWAIPPSGKIYRRYLGSVGFSLVLSPAFIQQGLPHWGFKVSSEMILAVGSLLGMCAWMIAPFLMSGIRVIEERFKKILK